jgi:predicted RecA/RadA family phage recombinase
VTNLKYNYGPGVTLNVAASDPASPTSGAPVRFGTLCGVAERDMDASSNTLINVGPIVATLSVKGVDGSGNSAVAVGDKLYYTDADTPKVAKKTTGTFIGFALATVGSSSTASIDVLVSR